MLIDMAVIAREHNAVRSSGQALAAAEKAATLGRRWLPRATTNDLRRAMVNLDSLIVGWRSMGPDKDVSGQWPTARRVVERVYIEINGIAGVEQRREEVSFVREVLNQAVETGESIASAGRAVGSSATKLFIAVVVVLVLVLLIKRS